MTPYYEDESVTLWHGDCLEILTWLDADVLVTDPPYGIAWEAGRFSSGPSAKRANKSRSIANDESTEVRDAVLQMWRVGQRPAVMFGSWRVQRPAATSNRLIWHKAGRAPGLLTAGWYAADEEIYLIGSGWIGGPTPNVITTSEWRSQQPGLVGHPTPKPIALMERLIEHCPPGTIADPFAGSGSTLVAARNLGRKAIGVEIDERYCETAARRLSQGVLFGGDAA